MPTHLHTRVVEGEFDDLPNKVRRHLHRLHLALVANQRVQRDTANARHGVGQQRYEIEDSSLVRELIERMGARVTDARIWVAKPQAQGAGQRGKLPFGGQ